MEERSGVIRDIIFHNKDNGYTIAVFENEEEQQQFTVVGVLPGADRGRSFRLTGTFKVHPTYGEQFSVSSFEEQMPTTHEGIEGFLASGALKGIGRKTAAAIVRKFGEETLRILEEEPDRLQEVEGIGVKKADAIASAYALHREFASVALFFQQYGISAAYAMKLYKVYGSDTIDAVKANPYQLVDDVFGIGFRKADAIAEKMGVPKDDPYRIESGIRYTLWHCVNEGNTYLPQKLLCERAAEVMELSTEQVYETLVSMAFEGDVQIESLEGRPVVLLQAYYKAEQNVCKGLVALNNSPLKPLCADIDRQIAITETESGIHLSDNQKYAVKSSLVSGVSVITGGPGTGKTTIINSLMNILTHCGFNTAIAAPTGRAAKRITETSGYPAMTIHRLLEYYYSEGEDAMRFGRTSENPLDYDAIIIDEASMIDILLMNGLISAIRPGTRLIIVGDSDQLPSVGAGNVLRDILESELIYSVRLTEIFRQARESLIVVNAHKINRGEYPDCNEKDKDFFFMRKKGEREMLATIRDLCTTRLPNYYTHRDPMKDIQVLTPVRKGIIGSINLNQELQALLNPPSEEKAERKFGERIFRVGDKVMQIRNNYQLSWKKYEDFSEGQGVFNGEVGFITAIDREFNELTVVFDDEKYATYDFTNLDELEHAYAMTVHKSQGSEFPIVILPVSWFTPVLATRNLLYTAVTRGKEAVILVGSEQRMHDMVDNNSITQRYSGLAARLRAFLIPERG